MSCLRADIKAPRRPKALYVCLGIEFSRVTSLSQLNSRRTRLSDIGKTRTYQIVNARKDRMSDCRGANGLRIIFKSSACFDCT